MFMQEQILKQKYGIQKRKKHIIIKLYQCLREKRKTNIV